MGLYYLQSRYYDPEVGRFINADTEVATGIGIIGNNMFAYCNNNPVVLVDTNGREPEEAIDTDGDGEVDCYVYTYTYEVGILWWKNEKTGKVYIYTNTRSEQDFKKMVPPEGFNSDTDLLIADWTDHANPTMYAYQAQHIKEKHRSSIVDIMFEYTEDFSKSWERTKSSVLTEWKEHHRYAVFSARAQNVDFDVAEEGKGFFYFLKKAVEAVLN